MRKVVFVHPKEYNRPTEMYKKTAECNKYCLSLVRINEQMFKHFVYPSFEV